MENFTPDEKLSNYPQAMDEYFAGNEVIIKVIPSEFRQDIESEIKDFRISSATQYIEYLESEIAFWKEKDPNSKLSSLSNASRLSNAKNRFDSSLKSYLDGDATTGVRYLQDSINYVKSGSLYSKTRLVSVLLSYSDKSSNFFTGFRKGLSDKRESVECYTHELEGFTCAMAFRNIINNVHEQVLSSIPEYKSLYEKATTDYSVLNEKYTKAFHHHQNEINEMNNNIQQHYSKLDEENVKYYNEKEKRSEELEHLYREKLRLEAPAEYWDKMMEKYQKEGMIWLAVSGVIAVAIMVGLIFLLKALPNMFTEDSHWVDAIKNSAMLTVITSIAVYILRITVKMAMSSFHLSRDAKERSNLSIFYLALIEKGAVTEKERALVINALFSRADTGLLKGDSNPVMSANVTSLVDSLDNGGK